MPISDKQYDFLHGWGMWPTAVRAYDAATPATEAYTLLSWFKVAPANLKQTTWLRVQYDAPLDDIAAGFTSRLPKILMDAVSVQSDHGLTTHVFIYKPTQHNIRSLLTLDTFVPTLVEVAMFGQGLGQSNTKEKQRQLITSFQKLPGKHSTNMYVGKAGELEEHTAKSLFEFVKKMSDEDYEQFNRR